MSRRPVFGVPQLVFAGVPDFHWSNVGAFPAGQCGKLESVWTHNKARSIWRLVSDYIARIIHLYYRESLKKAFFANGEDCEFRELSECDACPNMILGCSVNDFARPTDTGSFGDFTMTPTSMGGERTRFRPMPPWMKMSRAMGITGAALDAFLLQMDKISVRWWTTTFNIAFGDWVRFGEWPVHGFLRKFRCSISTSKHPYLMDFFDKAPVALCIAGVQLLMLLGSLNTPAASLADCGRFYILVSIGWYGLWGLVLASFIHSWFTTWLLMSPVIRQIHLLLQHPLRAPDPPIYLYLSDGGIFECQGMLSLWRRRTPWMIFMDAAADPKATMRGLRDSLVVARRERLCSVFDISEPRRDIEYVFQEWRESSAPYLHLGVLYEAREGLPASTGQMFVVRARLPLGHRDSVLVQGLLTREELMGHDSAAFWRPTLPRRRLNGICCECCHVACSCASSFPNISTGNQFVTPLMCSALCRLGYELSTPAVRELTKQQDLARSRGGQPLPLDVMEHGLPTSSAS
mmetsp:Transcript_45901/g.121348  ORF Transcript_45901/g.121348 Transcript_45901/m.121348 type:complete len:518 (-) Transcript_45901:67-1620(-)